MWKHRFLILLLGIFFSNKQVIAQGSTEKKKLEIIKADRYNFQKLDSLGEFLSLAGNVLLKQGKTLFYCDSAVLNQKENIVEAFGHIHINDADSVHTYSDYLKYLGNEKKAHLNKNVRLTDGKGTLTTNDLEYETEAKIGIYKNGGKLVNQKTVLTSKEGTYYGDTKDVYFIQKVNLTNPEYHVTTDTLLYNIDTEIATFITATHIKNGKRKIFTKDGFYDLKNKKAFFGKRPTIEDSTSTITAENIAFEDSTGYGEAAGNVVYKDSAQGFVILSNNLKSNSKSGSLLATQKPLLIIKHDADSIYISADTLFSAKIKQDSSQYKKDTIKGKLVLTKPDSTLRYFEAYYHVRIFSDSVQAISDSMYFSGIDSIFKLFKNPVIWSQDNQILGDTVFLYTKNQKPQLLKVWENALAINKVNTQFFNQLKSNTLFAYFSNENIDSIRAKGSAENIYYAIDEEDRFIAVNKSEADIIDIYLKEKKPEKVVFRNNLKGKTTPIKQANHEALKLKGFLWLESKRPKTKTDLF
jgi:lipopolysaccharide export system protein LptA